jgi:hypothetical protein
MASEITQEVSPLMVDSVEQIRDETSSTFIMNQLRIRNEYFHRVPSTLC